MALHTNLAFDVESSSSSSMISVACPLATHMATGLRRSANEAGPNIKTRIERHLIVTLYCYAR
jgi:hypothetical protein